MVTGYYGYVIISLASCDLGTPSFAPSAYQRERNSMIKVSEPAKIVIFNLWKWTPMTLGFHQSVQVVQVMQAVSNIFIMFFVHPGSLCDAS